MGKRNPIQKASYINMRYKEYLKSTFRFGNDQLQALFEEQLKQEELYKGPYVDLNLPFKRGKSLNDLIDEGIVCKSFRRLGDMNFERPLYSHQEEAIRKIGSGRGAIITTGTGSGKTECFLYPILNELMSELENNNREIGIRAIFLYPMNALVNDQMDRVRQILSECPDITYGFFTGDTPEKATEKFRREYAENNAADIPENEILSREEIRSNPPHILFTNYSMLEYLLIRPNDYAIFTAERLRNWKFVVMDEAHTYHGSLGIELSMLMRRLTGLADRKPRFILTSATLGQQGKSEQDIVHFGRSLTSYDFTVDDIIFSKRIVLQPRDVRFRIKGSDYLALKENPEDKSAVDAVCLKYGIKPSVDSRESLFELLRSDGNVYDLYILLKDGSKKFSRIAAEYSERLTGDEIIALIDLINMSSKEGIGIFDLKYHSFVRPLSGAFATVGENPVLKLTKTNTINGLRAFEVGNCRYCSSPYIMGRVIRKKEDQLEYLYQNNEIDIYENYGSNESVTMDYFLIENSVNEEVDTDILVEYKLCSKCGHLHVAANLNAQSCDCGSEYMISVFKVLQNRDADEGIAYNNINQCPCCGRKSNSGIVRSLNLGKDEGTALIGQMLMEALDDGKEFKKKKRKLSLRNRQETDSVSEQQVKQYLAFSDSRQQASFAAVFLDANHIKMLEKRMIWKIIEDQKYRDIPFDEAASLLTKLIRERDLIPNDLTPHKNAWAALLVDLLKIDGNYDSEGMGLYYFDLDLQDIMEQLDDEDIEETFGQYNIGRKELADLIQMILGVFKTTPAIDYTKSTLTPDERRDILEYRRFNNYVVLQNPKTVNGVRSLLPVKANENMIVRYVMKACGCSAEEAREIIELIFNQLAVEGNLVQKHETKQIYEINASRYVIKNYKTSQFYVCTKCGRLTPYNINGVCVHDRCDGTLTAVDPDRQLADNYYRNQYKTKKIEPIVIKEHTAQLDRKTAKQYQRDFKDKKINILSCSTTFEMGIDIGNLETVFMRNVPPTPANYVQRAGRAGRRKESSAFILTYCGTTSHDYTYYNEPEKMISGVINPPFFDVQNRKIIIRHLMAACFGAFFRENPDYFNTVNKMVFGDGEETFNAFVSDHPKELENYIDQKVIPESIYDQYKKFRWFDEMGSKDEKLEHFINVTREMAEEYQQAKEAALKEEKYSEADFYTRQIDKLHKTRMIDALSKHCVIPKYGFPVDVVELQIYKEGVPSSKYDLSRDLRIAISEYAPDSEVIVDGEKYTSKYVTRPKTSDFAKNYFCTCPSCRKVNVFIRQEDTRDCKYCGETIGSVRHEYYIEPVYGFKTGVTKESTRMKPKKSYAGEISYLGGGIQDGNTIDLNGVMKIETSSDDELLVVNRSNFYMCPVCGYSDINKARMVPPQIVRKHKNFRQFDCGCEEMNNLRLGHRFRTDVARISIPALDVFDEVSRAKALSFMYAFIEGISIAFDIERTDIDGILELNRETSSYDVLVYDNVPGGAGHVKRLGGKEDILKVLYAAHAKVSQKCCDEDTSCYNCLRNFYNQMHHSRLKRSYARDKVEELIRMVEAC